MRGRHENGFDLFKYVNPLNVLRQFLRRTDNFLSFLMSTLSQVAHVRLLRNSVRYL